MAGRVVKTVVGCWRGYLSGVRCRFAHGPADASATHCLLQQEIQIGFTFLLPAHLGSPRHSPGGRKMVEVVAVVIVVIVLSSAPLTQQ